MREGISTEDILIRDWQKIRCSYRCPADFTGGEILGRGVNGAAVQKIRDFKIVVFTWGED
jgi:hypothetical protein